MHLSVYLPLLFSAMFGLAAPTMGKRLPPAATTWLLSAGGLFAAAGSAASFTLLAFTLVGQSPPIAARGQWSEPALRHADPVATPIAVAAAVTLLLLTIRFVAAGLRRTAALRAVYQLCAELPGAGAELAVIDQPGRHAYAVPGRPGRIVMSTMLLRSLDAGERRAVLAHERAHLTHRHHLHHLAAHLAVAANPMLWRLPAAVARSTERWADEDAAVSCRRKTVAAALTRVATGIGPPVAPKVALAAACTDVAGRVQALNCPPAKLRLWRIALLLGLLIAIAVTVAEAAHDTERLFEFAQFAYRTGYR